MDELLYNLLRKMVHTPSNFKVEEDMSGGSFTLSYLEANVFIRSWYFANHRYSGSYFHKDFSHTQILRIKQACRHIKAMQIRNL